MSPDSSNHPASTTPPMRRAHVVGLGLIGASIAARLRELGWYLTGEDVLEGCADEAIARGVIDAHGDGSEVEITFVATPVGKIVECVERVLALGDCVVTDVGSVKEPVVEAVAHERFVGGHPMAGSDRHGLDAVTPELFQGATWVLTPGVHTDPEAYVLVRQVVVSLGADVVTLDPVQHDQMVATISHVPHLTATSLMNVALDFSYQHDAVLRLAAGGFRDMTRIAAGHPSLWSDIVVSNKEAIADGLARLIAHLEELRELIVNKDREQIEKVLGGASAARRELPLRAGRPAELSQLSIVIPDQPGAVGEVLGMFGPLGVNVEDLEINHAIDGRRGTLLVTIATSGTTSVITELSKRGFAVTVEEL